MPATAASPASEGAAALPRVWTVSQLTADLKSRIEGGYRSVDLEAEISGWRLYPSGHAYFTLKDEGAQLSAVMFKSAFDACADRLQLKDGAKVKVRGALTVYAQRGQYQLVVRRARLAGIGELMRRYLELKAKLEAEGLFAPARRRPLPSLPRRIGIVTSEAGAVIHDMCTVLTRRFPALEIRLYPSLVQGAGAAETIAAGVRHFNACTDWRADLLIVARGGGSFEDLFCFNDENLVRTVAASEIPTISAVGHETDFTLCDFAADRRAGTPSIAAEIAVPLLGDLRDRISSASAAMTHALRAKGEYFAQRLDHLSDSMAHALRAKGESFVLRVNRFAEALSTVLAQYRERLERRVERAADKLALLSPFSVLDRGYSLTTAADGSVVREAEALKPGDVLVTRLQKGSVRSVVSA